MSVAGVDAAEDQPGSIFYSGSGRKHWLDAGPFRSFESVDHAEETEELTLAAVEELRGLPATERLRTVLLREEEESGGGAGTYKAVNVKRLSKDVRKKVVERAMNTSEQDNERLLKKVRSRINAVGLELPQVEVRFRDLVVEAKVYAGSRALPSILNFYRNAIESLLTAAHLHRSTKRTFRILKHVNGILKPGRITLLLGPPGSGKSTLMRALAGKTDDNLTVSGEITYNGHTLKEFVPQRTASYISQVDNHIGELTVRETFDFAARCQGAGYRFQLIQEAVKREEERGIVADPDVDAFMKSAAVSGKRKSLMTDYMLKILGLDVCADTLVGNEMLRGISGGQKKRVTTGEMAIGSKKVIFADEISTGLDSSTTFQIVKAMRNYVHLLDATMLMALLQPAPETFELFDDVILMAEGYIVYQGPRERVLEFFERVGFRCPPRKGTADFLQEVTSKKDQQAYWVGNGPYSYVPVKTFCEAFRNFELGQELQQYLSQPYDRNRSHPAALTYTKYGLPQWQIFRACAYRELLLMSRHRFLYIFRTGQVVFNALIVSTLFFRTTLHPNNVTDGNLYLAVLFFSLIHMMFNGFSEMSITVGRLGIFYKQRDNLFYPAWAFSLPTWLLRVPYSLLEATIWSCIVYWVVGFAPDAGRFFTFWFLMFLMHQMALALFRLIGALGRTMTIANTFGSFALVVVFLLGGFILAKPYIHPWVIWGYWISPLSYAQNAIAVNEFTAPRWQKPLDGTTLGNAVLRLRGIFTERWWSWVGFGVLIGYIILFNIVVNFALQYLNPWGRAAPVLSEDVLRENDDTNGSGNEVHVDVKQLAANREASSDENSNRTSGISSPQQLAAEQRGEVPASHSDHQDLEHPQQSGLNTESLPTDGGMGGVSARTEKRVEKGMVLPFTPLAMTFHDVCYDVDMPKTGGDGAKLQAKKLRLLHHITGVFRPGVLTALVGVSGAGKTTLMDVLAGRKTSGYIEGDIKVGGFPKDQRTFNRIAGYVEQNDIHSPQLTVKESLRFSAILRLSPDVDMATKEKFVDEVMDLVELSSLAGALVGLPGVSGLSTEQRKRLTIAVELVANPSIIFMDEPTSGLDARAAAIVMRTVRNTVDTGRTVVCTIHQPSIDVFDAFDELLLMKRGGHVIYHGPLGHHSRILIDYFQGFEGVPQIPEGYNPSTWMLEITTPAMEERLGVSFAEAYRESAVFRDVSQMVEALAKPAPGSQPLSFQTVYASTPFAQYMTCLWKQSLTYWRSPDYNAVRYFYTVMLALIFGAVFWDLGTKRSAQVEVFNVMGALYAAVLFLGVSNSSTVQPMVAVERTVFYRERAAGMYGPLSYAMAQGAIELPYVLLQAILYSVITYAMIQFEWTAAKFFWYLLFMYLTLMYFTFYGMMAVALTPSQQMAAVVSSTFYSIWNLFSGFLIPRPLIPGWWIWYYWINPVAWTLYGLITSQLGDVTSTIQVATTASGGSATVPVKDFIRSYFGYRHSMLGVVVAVLCGFNILLWAVFAFGIKFLNFQRR